MFADGQALVSTSLCFRDHFKVKKREPKITKPKDPGFLKGSVFSLKILIR